MSAEEEKKTVGGGGCGRINQMVCSVAASGFRLCCSTLAYAARPDRWSTRRHLPQACMFVPILPLLSAATKKPGSDLRDEVPALTNEDMRYMAVGRNQKRALDVEIPVTSSPLALASSGPKRRSIRSGRLDPQQSEGFSYRVSSVSQSPAVLPGAGCQPHRTPRETARDSIEPGAGFPPSTWVVSCDPHGPACSQ